MFSLARSLREIPWTYTGPGAGGTDGAFEDIPAAADRGQLPAAGAKGPERDHRRDAAELTARGFVEQVSREDGDPAVGPAPALRFPGREDGVLPGDDIPDRLFRGGSGNGGFGEGLVAGGRDQGFEALAQAGAMPGHRGAHPVAGLSANYSGQRKHAQSPGLDPGICPPGGPLRW